MTPETTPLIRFALPKGRMQDSVTQLMADAGVRLRASSRGYRPLINLPGVETKVLKPQNIVEMLHHGSRDLGFAGGDWVREKGFEGSLVCVLDTGLDPVRIVAAAPRELLVDGALPKQPLRVASEYERLTRAWIADGGLDATFVRSYGATEVFPPEDADCIVDNPAPGATPEANGFNIVDEHRRSSTRLYANPRALEVPEKRTLVEDLVLLLESVLQARKRVMIEVNVTRDRLDAVVAALPCMREPTIAALHGDAGYAVKAAVPRDELPRLIPALKAHGGTDVVVSKLDQIVP